MPLHNLSSAKQNDPLASNQHLSPCNCRNQNKKYKGLEKRQDLKYLGTYPGKTYLSCSLNQFNYFKWSIIFLIKMMGKYPFFYFFVCFLFFSPLWIKRCSINKNSPLLMYLLVSRHGKGVQWHIRNGRDTSHIKILTPEYFKI